MKFIHVVRDARDMAFSSNMNQLRKHGDVVLGRAALGLPQPVRAAMLWNTVNNDAADYGEQSMKSGYCRVSFEEVCRYPDVSARRIADFVGLSEPSYDQDEKPKVHVPDSVGRWRNESAEIVGEIERAAGKGLARFGYTGA
jgi:hypothetical protein